MLERKLALARKVELLCLHDVEYRVLQFLADLAGLVKPLADGSGSQIPITQLELADLVGATRETTSTTLNQLERRGLIKLSRRMMTVPSPDVLRSAAREKSANTVRPTQQDEASATSSSDTARGQLAPSDTHPLSTVARRTLPQFKRKETLHSGSSVVKLPFGPIFGALPSPDGASAKAGPIHLGIFVMYSVVRLFCAKSRCVADAIATASLRHLFFR